MPLLLLPLVGCLDHEPIAPKSRPGALRLAVSASGAAGEMLDVQVYYPRTDGSRTMLAHLREPLGSDARDVPVEVDLSTCLADPQRAGASGEEAAGCPVHATVTVLTAGGSPLDLQEIGPVVVRPGERRALEAEAGLRWIAVSAGQYHSCGIVRGGATYCWGAAGNHLGTGSTTAELRPRRVAGDHRFVQLSTAGSGTCARTADGVAYCWGTSVTGALGNGSNDSPSVPTRVVGGLSFVSVQGGAYVSCGLTAEGGTHCWGDNRYGALGSDVCTDRTTNDACASFVPSPVSGDRRFDSITVGMWRACGLEASGAAYCWGNLVADDGRAPSSVPVPVGQPVRFSTLSVGPVQSCGIAVDGRTFCWGINYLGVLGTGSRESETAPTEVAGGHRFRRVVALDENNQLAFSCGIELGGAAWCWGANQAGQLGGAAVESCRYGAGEVSCSTVPIAVSGGHAFADVALGIDHACGVTTDGALYCWGGNEHGQLGDGTRTGRATPVRVLPPQ